MRTSSTEKGNRKSAGSRRTSADSATAKDKKNRSVELAEEDLKKVSGGAMAMGMRTKD